MAPDKVGLVGSGPVIVYRTVQLIQNVLPTNGRTDERRQSKRSSRTKKKNKKYFFLKLIGAISDERPKYNQAKEEKIDKLAGLAPCKCIKS